MSINILLKDVKKVKVLLREGTDSVSILLEDTSAFPSCGYPTTLSVETQSNQGIPWCRDYLGVAEPEIINTRKNREV